MADKTKITDEYDDIALIDGEDGEAYASPMFSVEDLLNADMPLDGGELTRTEKRRRMRSIRVSKALFRAIDIVFNKSQNTCPYVNRKNAGTIKRTKDIVYDESAKDVCRMDVYRVKSESKQPAVIYIHGGGFTAGGREYRKGQSQFFALNGFTVFCIDYGLSPAYTYPESLKHIVNAANFIYDHADEYNIDRDRIMVAGDSAGGYYAAMLGAFNCGGALADAFGFAPKFRIFGALLICGLYDMETVLQTKYALDIDDAVFLSLTGVREDEFEAFAYKHACEPIGFVDGSYPPAFIMYAARDLFCKGQGEIFSQKLNDCGVYFESYSARHATSNHCFSLNWRGEDATAANELMMSFAKRLAAGKIVL